MIKELIQKLESYLDGSLSRDSFELWFYDLSYDVEKRWGGSVVDFVHEIEATFAESSSGNWPLSVLDCELAEILQRYKPQFSSTLVIFNWGVRDQSQRGSAPLRLLKVQGAI